MFLVSCFLTISQLMQKMQSRWKPITFAKKNLIVRIDIITLLPELIKSPFEASILKRAIEKEIVEVHMHDLRKYGLHKYNQVDDYQYGGGAGMVMMIEPIDKMIADLSSERSYDEIIYMTPDGTTLNQGIANHLSTLENIIILCGHYKGVDQRVRDLYVTKEISIGDYVLSGGELGAAVLCDSIIRLIPGVISDETSALTDSFQDGILAPPVYTRPSDYKGHKVPDILLSGNLKAIEQWREDQAMMRTEERRPDLLED
jgi:tRNA (guanine37-N1)-methyltransferase